MFRIIVCGLSLILLNGCGFASQRSDVDALVAQQNENREKQEQINAINNQRRIEDRKAREAELDKTNPEVHLSGVGDYFKEPKMQSLRKAFNDMPFMTRYPDTNDPKKVYVYVGDAKITLLTISLSVRNQLKDCSRISSYSDYDLKDICIKQVANGLSMYSKMLKDPKTPDIAKKSATNEATYGGGIAFEHAARLVKMYNKECKNQHGVGYVHMNRFSVPCTSS